VDSKRWALQAADKGPNSILARSKVLQGLKPTFILLRLRPGDPEGTPAAPFYKAFEFLYLGEFFRSLQSPI